MQQVFLRCEIFLANLRINHVLNIGQSEKFNIETSFLQLLFSKSCILMNEDEIDDFYWF